MLDLINVELINTLMIGEGKKKEKLEIYKSTGCVNCKKFFSDQSSKILEPKKIALLCREYPELIDEDFPLIILVETPYGELAILEVTCCCGRPKFNALDLNNLELSPNTKIVLVC